MDYINEQPVVKNVEPSSLLKSAELAFDNMGRLEVTLIKEAEELFKQQVDHMKSIDQLKRFHPNMETVEMNTKELSSIVEASTELVKDVCGKIKQIELAKSRLEDCLLKIGDVLDLKTCQDGIDEAIRENNFEVAAMHIKRYLSIDQDSLRKTISIINNKSEAILQSPHTVNSQTMQLALNDLNRAKDHLLKLCQENLVQAIKENNTKDIDRFFKIFPLLNEHEDGLLRYSEYLKDQIVNPIVDETFKSIKCNQAEKLAALFESIAKLIDSHQPLVETYYGPGHLISIVKTMQKGCDDLSRKILEEFRDVTKLQYVVKTVRNSSLQMPIQVPTLYGNPQIAMSSMTQSKLDPRDVDKILNEISMIISRSEVYLNFVVQRVKDDINLKSENDSQKQASLLELYNLVCVNCQLNHIVQEVDGIYVALEQFYLNESSKKAILMDQIDVEQSSSATCYISSMLDDIFFIIKKCTKRAISTKSNEVFCAIINHCVTLLESTFCKVLEDRISKNQHQFSRAFTSANFSQAYSAIQSGRYLQSTNEFENAKTQYFSALNNLDRACDYVKTLRNLLDNDIKKLKPSLSVLEHKQDNQLEKSATCLNELSQLSNKFTSVINPSLYQLFDATLKDRLRMELKTILSDNPEILNDLDEVHDLARTLIIRFERSLKDNLTSQNHEKLVLITKEFLISSFKTLKL